MGTLAILIAVLAGPLGLEPSSGGMSWRQTLAVLLGLLSVLFGFRWRRQARG